MMLKKENIEITNEVLDAESALRAIGTVMLDAGSITSDYIDNMITSYRELGPYFVIAPGIAIAHAKPDESVLANDIALIVCQRPVRFNSHNDPVSLLFGLCATNGHGHMDVLVQLSEMLSDQHMVTQLKQSTNKQQLIDLIDRYSQP